MKKTTTTELPILDVLATSFAAHRINNSYCRETRRFSDNLTKFANKELMLYKLNADQFLPDDFKGFRVTQADRKTAVEAINWLQKDNALDIIADRLSDFMQSVMHYISSEKVDTNTYGVVAVVPKVYFEGAKKKTLKKELKTSFSESKHIGAVGETIQGMFTLNETRFIEKYSCNVFNGYIDNNLVSFFKNIDQTQVVPKEGTTFKIKGKVKRCGENFITKLPETQLNYIRFKVDNK